MDRLLCGDVGVGKTEVALRAAFKCVMGGKQCAILAPTTILAWQHFNTALTRMESFPIRIGLLSRYRTAKEQKETLRGLKDGTVDIVVGTHRLLSGDVKFKDLGLVIIDEEQRFGVKHKEKLKENFIGVNLPQQRIFWDSLLTRQTGTGEHCSPLQEIFDSLTESTHLTILVAVLGLYLFVTYNLCFFFTAKSSSLQLAGCCQIILIHPQRQTYQT